MKFKFSDKYKEKPVSFPSDDLPEDQKRDKKYFSEATRAIVGKYVRGLTELPFDRFENREPIKVQREYASGDQSIDRYKDVLIGHKGKNGNRPAHTMNISWRPMDILPKKLSDVEGYLRKIKYDVSATAIDRQAIMAKESVKALTKLSIKPNIAMFHEHLNKLAGEAIVTQDPELAQQPQNLPFSNDSQIEMFAENGGFQLEQENAIAILNDKTNTISTGDILDNMLRKDIVQIGICASKIHRDKGSNIIKRKYVDPDRLIIPYSIFPDFRDKTYVAVIETMTIYQLRTETDLTEEELIQIAKQYNDANHSGTKLYSFYEEIAKSRANGLGLAVLDSIEVDVVDAVWLGTKTTRQTRIVREKDGGLALNKVDDKYKLKEADRKRGKELKEYSTQCVYKAKMILGSDFVFDYGQETNIAFEKTASGRRVAVLPFDVFKTGEKSLTEKCIGFADDINIALFKKRMSIKNLSTGPNIQIKKSAFENVMIDNKLMSPAALMKLYTDEGFLIVDDSNVFSQNTSQSRAIEIIPSGVSQQLVECANEIERNMRLIEDVTGLNDVFSASSPKSEQGLGVSQMAVNATENSLFTIVDSFHKHKEAYTRTASHMWKVSARYMTDDEKDQLGVSKSLKVISISKDIAEYDYDMKVSVGISEQEIQDIKRQVSQLTDYRRQAGTGGLKPSDGLLLMDILSNGNIKQARMALAQIEEYRAQEDERIAQQRYQENAQLQQQSAAQASESAQQETVLEGEVKKDVEISKIFAQMELEKVKGEEARKTAAATNIYGSWGLHSYAENAKAR